MIYPKNREPFSETLFQNPSCEYRATPFWAWNDRLDPEELCWQIERFKAMGFGGFHMHVRTGLVTPYMSEAYLDAVRTCVEKAKKEKMLAWLYDEDRWPSGAAGGLVTKDPRYRQRWIAFSRKPVEEGKLIAVFDVQLDENGCLKAAERVTEHTAEAKGFLLYVTRVIAPDNSWFNGQAYLNTLDKDAVRRFIEETHEKYLAAVGADFGRTVPAIFTDEPQFSRKETLAYADSESTVRLPWSDDLPDTYRKAWGEDVIDRLPELIWDLPDGKISLTRYRYHDHIAARFAEAFADQIGAWCGAHGLMLTGHMMEEPTLKSQTAALGDCMRSYRGFQLPGIDMLCDWREYTTAKQAQSASRQYGREGVLSELYGVTNWDFDFRAHKLAGDWQAALGVTVRVPHLSWLSMHGEAKRDYPATFNYQSPWYREYPLIEDHFARVNTALTRGKASVRVAVVHPVESYWLHWGAQQNTEDARERLENRFLNLTDWLLRGQIDFDFLCESNLPSLAGKQDGGAVLTVGAMRYDTVIVPGMETIRSTTLDLLSDFRARGGRVIFLEVPQLENAVPSRRPALLAEKCERCEFEKVSILRALEEEREVRITGENGALTGRLLIQVRNDGEEKWLFAAQALRQENADAVRGEVFRFRVRGAWKAVLYDTMTGRTVQLATAHRSGWSVFEHKLYDQDSLLVRLIPGDAEQPGEEEKERERGEAVRLPEKVSYTQDEPNCLILDRAQWQLDGGEWHEKEEILRLANLVRRQLGWPDVTGRTVQPWVERDTREDHLLRLRFEFDSEIELSGCEIALEGARKATVTLNGAQAAACAGYYTDKCIGKQSLPPVKKGRNLLEIALPYGRSTDVEAAFVLGDFGVRVNGTVCTLFARPGEIAFGDITRQGFPFYGGSLTYRLRIPLSAGRHSVETTYFRAPVISVSVDGRKAGLCALSPYRVDFETQEDGPHEIEIKCYGCRVNTFGQLHNVHTSSPFWWGPASWRSEGDQWMDEYQLRPQGILKAPVIR